MSSGRTREDVGTTAVGVLGATGLVGREMLALLEERGFPVGRLVLLASPSSAGRALSFRGEEVRVEAADECSMQGLDLVLASAGASVSRRFLPAAAEAGTVCIDNSSAFRMNPEVPLVVPEVNGHLIRGAPLIANPNCSTIQLVCALAPLHADFEIEKVRVATYQSLSGAGGAALRTFDDSDAEPDLLPQIGALAGGSSEEERKLVRETTKILDADLGVDATCVRVPIRIGHAEAVWIETRKPLSVEAAARVLESAPGVSCDGADAFATPVGVAGTNAVRVGRLRSVGKHELAFWVVADNLRKGAALNAVQIAEVWRTSRG